MSRDNAFSHAIYESDFDDNDNIDTTPTAAAIPVNSNESSTLWGTAPANRSYFEFESLENSTDDPRIGEVDRTGSLPTLVPKDKPVDESIVQEWSYQWQIGLGIAVVIMLTIIVLLIFIAIKCGFIQLPSCCLCEPCGVWKKPELPVGLRFKNPTFGLRSGNSSPSRSSACSSRSSDLDRISPRTLSSASVDNQWKNQISINIHGEVRKLQKAMVEIC